MLLKEANRKESKYVGIKHHEIQALQLLKFKSIFEYIDSINYSSHPKLK